MRFCTNCGAQLEEGVKFCTECGQQLQSTAAPIMNTPEKKNFTPADQAEPALYGSYGEPVAAPAQPEQGDVSAQAPATAEPVTYTPPAASEAASNHKKTGGIKLLPLILAGVLAIGILVGLFFLSGSKKDSDAPTDTTTAPIDDTTELPADAATEPSISEVGFWTLKYCAGDEEMAMDEETVEMLKSMGIVFYLELLEDGTGIFMLDEPLKITWGDGILTADDGSSAPYTLEDGQLIVDIEGSLLYFVPDDKDSTPIVDNPPETQTITSYVAISGSMDGTAMEEDDLNAMGGITLTFFGDGTGTLNMFNQTEDITYDGETITRSDVIMPYQLEGDYLYLFVSDAEYYIMLDQDAMSFAPQESLDPDTLASWEGDYYGWWMFESIIVGDSDNQGRWWDCCINLDLEEDGTGYLTVWDQDFGKDDPIALVEVSVSLQDGVVQIISESGDFMGCPVEYGDWILYSGATEYADAIGFTAPYVDEFNEIECFFFLRPWGTLWDDVEEENLPGFYYDWYLPLIQDGVTVAPGTIG